MNTEEIMYEVSKLGLKDTLFTEMKRLEEHDPHRYKNFELLIETAFNNINKETPINESI